jgi:hypothetical protein
MICSPQKNIRLIIGPKKKHGLLLLIFLATCFCKNVKAQEDVKNSKQQELSAYERQTRLQPGLTPTFFAKESAKGSPYLSLNWMRGVVEFTDKRIIPGPDESMYFNYDKYNNRLYVINGQYKIWSYPIDSISGFILADSPQVYSFEKIPAIGNDFFLQSIVKSENGYSLYKRLITTMTSANYRSEGYYTLGEKYDEYKNYDEYYLIYPDKHKYKKFYLNKNAIYKVFKNDKTLLDDYIKQPVTEKDLVAIVEALNTLSPQ